MTDCMLTVWSVGHGFKEVRVDGVVDIRQAIEVAEKATGCRVVWGRGVIASYFVPQLHLDADGEVLEESDDAHADAAPAEALL